MKKFLTAILAASLFILLAPATALAAIQDPAGNTLGAPYTSGEEYEIDKTAPEVVEINLITGTPTNATTVQFEVVFSETVTGVEQDDFSLNTSGLTGASIQSVAGSGATYTVTVSTGAGNSGTLALVIPASATIQDEVGNALAGLPITSAAYTIDRVIPTVSITGNPPADSNNTSATFLFTGSDNEGSISFECKLDGGDWQVCTSPVELTGLSAGEHTFSVRAVDTAGNVSAAESYTWTVDLTAPQVVSIMRVGNSPTNANAVQFLVTFSEAVTNVDSNDFVVVADGVSGAAVSGISGSGSTRTVTVNTGSGDGTLRLDIPDTATITDLAGTGISNKPFTDGESYTIDKTPPQVVSITRNMLSPTNAQQVTFTVTFSEPVTGVTPEVFTVVTTGTIQDAYVVSVTGSGTTYTVTVDTGIGSGTIRLDVLP